MSLPLPNYESFTQEGPGASTGVYTINNAGLYRGYITSTFGAGSTIAGSIVQAGSAIVTVMLPTPSAAQTHQEVSQLFSCQPGDTLTFAISDTDPKNSVKSLFNVIQVAPNV